MNPLYNKMVLDGLTLGEAYKLVRRANNGRTPHVLLVNGFEWQGMEVGEMECRSLGIKKGRLEIYDRAGWSPGSLDLSNKVKIIGDSIEYEDKDRKITLTFFREPSSINILEELSKPVKARRKSCSMKKN